MSFLDDGEGDTDGVWPRVFLWCWARRGLEEVEEGVGAFLGGGEWERFEWVREAHLRGRRAGDGVRDPVMTGTLFIGD